MADDDDDDDDVLWIKERDGIICIDFRDSEKLMMPFAEHIYTDLDYIAASESMTFVAHTVHLKIYTTAKRTSSRKRPNTFLWIFFMITTLQNCYDGKD